MKCFSGAICSFLAAAVLSVPAVAQQPKIYNTVKLKLAEGKQVFSYTQTKFDIALPIDEAQIAIYTGLYRQAELEINILTKRGKLFFRQCGLEFPMSKVGDHRFSIIPPGSSESYELVFVCSCESKAEYLHFGLRALKRVQTSS